MKRSGNSCMILSRAICMERRAPSSPLACSHTALCSALYEPSRSVHTTSESHVLPVAATSAAGIGSGGGDDDDGGSGGGGGAGSTGGGLERRRAEARACLSPSLRKPRDLRRSMKDERSSTRSLRHSSRLPPLARRSRSGGSMKRPDAHRCSERVVLAIISPSARHVEAPCR